MSTQLHEQLERLHVELGRASAVDAESRALLITLLGDITRLLESSSGVERSDDDDATLPDRMEAVAVQFEAEHPNLSAAIRGVVDALATAGI
jgi:ABC-type uncharacterized transport system substrate-binding protein